MRSTSNINVSNLAFKLWLLLSLIIFVVLAVTEKRNKDKSYLSYYGELLLWAWTIAGTILPVLGILYKLFKWLMSMVI